MPRKTLGALLASSALALTAAGTGALASPAAAALGGPEVTSVQLVTGSAGGVTPFVSKTCDELVRFTDVTPSDPSAYTASVAQVGGSYAGAVVPDASRPNEFQLSVPCDVFSDGGTYQIAVSENGANADASDPFTYSVTGHPERISATSQNVNGVEGFTPGRAVTVSFPSGSWEPGTKFSTQVWVSKTASFTAADYQANTVGAARLVGSYNSTSPVLTFTPPTTVQGMYVWYSVLGEVPGKAPWRFTFSAVPVHKLPAQPTGWVKSFGTQSGTAKIGTKVAVSPVVYSSTGKTKGLVAKYQWFVNNKTVAIPAATKREYIVNKAYKGSALTLRVTVVAKANAPRVKWYSFGTVQ